MFSGAITCTFSSKGTELDSHGTTRWNAARSFARYLDQNASELCEDKNILELGAGGGLPGLIAALSGAKNACAYVFNALHSC